MTKKLAPTPMLRRGLYSPEQVIDKVISVIEEEPRRLRMYIWLTMLRGQLHSAVFRLTKSQRPRCGTAACAAGWINIITRNEANGFYGEAALRKLFPFESKYNRYDTVGVKTFEAKIDLSTIFGKVRSRAPGVVKMLKEWKAKHHDVLQTKNVVVE
jgi:hypothetical protein